MASSSSSSSSTCRRFSTELLAPLQSLTTQSNLELSMLLSHYHEQLLAAMDEGINVNFAQAALAVQDWTQEYSRNVDALWRSVVDMLAFLVSGNSNNKDGDNGNSSSLGKRGALNNGRRPFLSGSTFQQRIQLDVASNKCLVEAIKVVALKTISVTPTILAPELGVRNNSHSEQQVLLYSTTADNMTDKNGKPEILGTKKELKCSAQFKHSTVCCDNELTLDDQTTVVLSTSFNFEDYDENTDNLLPVLHPSCDDNGSNELESAVNEDLEELISIQPLHSSTPMRRTCERECREPRKQPRRSCKRTLDQIFSNPRQPPLEGALNPVAPSKVVPGPPKKRSAKRKKKKSPKSTSECKKSKGTDSNNRVSSIFEKNKVTQSTSKPMLIDAKNAAQALIDKKLELEQKDKNNCDSDTGSLTPRINDSNDFHVNNLGNDHAQDDECATSNYDNASLVDEDGTDNDQSNLHAGDDNNYNNNCSYNSNPERESVGFQSLTDGSLLKSLSDRVSAWHAKLHPRLLAVQKRPLYDNEEYCERIIRRLSRPLEGTHDDDNSNDDITHGSCVNFKLVVGEADRSEVCRLFLSSLFLANKGNVEVVVSKAEVEGTSRSPSDKLKMCPQFKMDAIELRLLSPQLDNLPFNGSSSITQREQTTRTTNKRRRVVQNTTNFNEEYHNQSRRNIGHR